MPSLVPNRTVPTGGPPAMLVLIVKITVPEASFTIYEVGSNQTSVGTSSHTQESTRSVGISND